MSRRQSAPVLKDSYGFVVKRDHHELFKQYAPIWAKEEVERANLWTTFLLSFAPDAERDGGNTADQLDAACEAGLEPFKAALNEWREQRSSADGGNAEMPDWLPQLRCLVQAGVPRALRGRLWQAFLCLDGKREAGMYDQLVQKALGNTKYGRKRSQTSGEVESGTVPAAPSTEAPSSYHSQHSSDTESQSTTYAPAAASAAAPTVAEASADAAAANNATAQPSAAVDADTQMAEADRRGGNNGAAEPTTAEPAADPQPIKLTVRRTTSTGHTSVVSSEGGRRSHRSAEPWHPSTNDWNVQIEKDLHRTFPGHPLMNRSGRGALRRILAAYSRRNEAVGYCQGMNFIAGTMLLFMEEEDAFWALAAVVEDLLPGYFNMDLIAPQVDQAVFKHLVDQRFPTLCAHLTRHGVNVASMALNWFLTMFVTSLPLESTLRVWDVLFFDRCSSVLFRCALALVDIYAQALVATVDSIDAFTLLHAMAPMSFDASRLIDMACIAFAGLTMDQIQALRKAYRTTVVASKLNDSSEDDDAAWASSDGEASSVDNEAAPDSPSGPMGSGDYYSGSDDSDRSEEEAVTPSRLAQLSAKANGKAVSRTSNLDDVREYVRQIPSNELLAGNTAAKSTADLSPVSEASTLAEQPSPSPGGAAQAQSPAEQNQAAPGRSDGGLHAASAAASAVSRRLDRIASAHGAASRRLFGRKRSRNKGPAATGAAVLSGDAEALATAAVAHKSSAAAEAAYHIAATPFKTLPLARLEPGSTPLVEGLSPGDSTGDAATQSDAATSPNVTAVVTEDQHAASAHALGSSNAAERARRHIEAASSVVARTIGEAFGRNRPAEPDVPEGGRHAAAMAQLLSVVEGLEEELFAAEAACHEAEVEAAAAVRHSADARKELDAAVTELQEKAKVVDMLHDKLMGVNNTLAFFDGELQAKEKALAGVRAQIAERDQQIAHKDALIAQLVAANPKAAPQANGSAASEGQKGGGGAGGLFSKLRTNLARGPSANGDAGSPLPTPSSNRKGSWSLRSGRAPGDAQEVPSKSDGSSDAAAQPSDGGPPAGSQPESAAGSPTKAAMRSATAVTEAAGDQADKGAAPAAEAAQLSTAANDEAAAAAALQPRNLDEELPPPKNLDAAAQPPPGDQQEEAAAAGDQQQRPQQAAKQRSDEQQRAPAKDPAQLAREAQESAAELHARDLDAERAAKP